MSGRPNYGALSGVTRELLEPLWIDTRVTCQEIADRFGVHKTAIQKHRVKIGLPPKPKRGLSPDQRALDAKFRRLWLAGVRSADIARHLGISRKHVSRKKSAMGLPPRVSKGRGVGPGGFDGIRLSQYQEDRLAEAMRGASV